MSQTELSKGFVVAAALGRAIAKGAKLVMSGLALLIGVVVVSFGTPLAGATLPPSVSPGGSAPLPPPVNGQVPGTTVDTPVPGEPGAILGHSKPAWVKTTHEGLETFNTFHWDWTIPARHYLVLPAFHGTTDTPYVAASGIRRTVPAAAAYVWVGALTATASQGTGYGSFEYPDLNVQNICFGTGPATFIMTGWPQGSFLHNNVFAPLFANGHFSLTVTYTNSTTTGPDGSQVASFHVALQQNVNCAHIGRRLFPWK